MAAFAIDRHFDRQMMKECILILRTFGIRETPCERVSQSNHPTINCALELTRFRVHGQWLIFIHRNGFSHLPDCRNSRCRNWISCRSVYLGLHKFSPHMKNSLAWLYSSISQNLNDRGITCTGTLTYSLTPGREYACTKANGHPWFHAVRVLVCTFFMRFSLD